MTPDPLQPPPLSLSLFRTALRLACFLALIFAVHLLLDEAMYLTEALPPGPGRTVRALILGAALAAYALLIATPFVPGIEIGISLAMIRGPDIAPLLYLATAVGLMLAFLAGRFLPYNWIYRAMLDLRLRRACALLDQIKPLSPQERLDHLRARLPGRIAALALNYRYLVLAGLINLPGSAIIGGGGGICLLAGLTGLFALRASLLTIAIAVSPFPLVVWFWGPETLL
mgnify:CR=1 FL=1